LLSSNAKIYKIQKRASENGFDWKNPNDTLKKIDEERNELKTALDQQNIDLVEEEIGDLIFSTINLSRKLKIDPENALRNTNKKFKDRINYIEDKLKKENKTFEKSNLAKLEKLWNEAKKQLNR
jgi:Protein containing tetrapyrrole methyltransferase domain and MazG-like (predicted pyrophosphatase) domain